MALSTPMSSGSEVTSCSRVLRCTHFLLDVLLSLIASIEDGGERRGPVARMRVIGLGLELRRKARHD
jgi:hypothetical protein